MMVANKIEHQTLRVFYTCIQICYEMKVSKYHSSKSFSSLHVLFPLLLLLDISFTVVLATLISAGFPGMLSTVIARRNVFSPQEITLLSGIIVSDHCVVLQAFLREEKDGFLGAVTGKETLFYFLKANNEKVYIDGKLPGKTKMRIKVKYIPQ